MTDSKGAQSMSFAKDEAPIYIWGGAYTKLVVLDIANDVEIAVITEDDIDTVNPDIVVKLTPKYD